MRKLTIQLPDDFLDLCDYDMVSPEKVLCDFIADLCNITDRQPEHGAENYITNKSGDRDRAQVYYDRIHGWQADWFRQNVPHLVERIRARQVLAPKEVCHE